MLHFASTAKVDRPLALDAGVLPEAGTGVGVAQLQGWVCEPSSTGPPRTWLVSARLAHGRPLPLPLESATKVFSPGVMPVSTPRSVRLSSSATKSSPTSTPLSVSVTFVIGTVIGTRTSTSASPSLSRSARLDSVRISKLNGGSSASAPLGIAAPPPALQPATPTTGINSAPIRVRWARLMTSPPSCPLVDWEVDTMDASPVPSGNATLRAPSCRRSAAADEREQQRRRVGRSPLRRRRRDGGGVTEVGRQRQHGSRRNVDQEPGGAAGDRAGVADEQAQPPRSTH